MKIAITGIGLVSPAGVGLEQSLARLAQGPLVPVGPPASEAGSGPRPTVLNVPAEYRPRDFARKRKDLKLMARANRLAIGAAVLAVADAGLQGADLSDAGLFLGVGREPGSIKDILPALAHSRGEPHDEIDLSRLATEGVRWMNPLSSLKTLPNMSVAHVSIVTGTMGPSMALCDGPDSSSRALLEGATAIIEGRAPMVLAGGADSRVAFSDRSAVRRLGLDESVGEAAAIFVLEPLASARARGAHIYGLVGPSTTTTDAAGAFGDCGAARGAATLALAMGRGESADFAPVCVHPIEADCPPLAPIDREDPIVITGIGCATPLGDDTDEFAQRLLDGESAAAPIRSFDAGPFPVSNACEATSDLLSSLPATLRSALSGMDDRRSALALLSGLRAAKDHGALHPEAAIVYATGLTSVSTRELEQDILPYLSESGQFDYPAFGAAKTPDGAQAPHRHLVSRPIDLLASHLDLRGPKAVHFSACAAGTAALGHALDIVRRGEAPMVLVGGSDSMVHPFGMLPFILLGATSPETDPARSGRPFEADRDGFVMGEGGAFFVIERLSSALAAGRKPRAVLRGWGSSTDAYNVTAPHPEGAGAVRAMSAALADAKLDADQIGYINAHGTGTTLNDGIEASAIRQVFGADAPPVSSCKAQIGHTIAAAGSLEALAVLSALEHQRLPPNAHLTAPDPNIELDLVGQVGPDVAFEYALSNSFGFGGQNACLVLARYSGAPE